MECVVTFERTMYAARDASRAWQDQSSEHLRARGFCGVAGPPSFLTRNDLIRLFFHGDDFAVMADQVGTDNVQEILCEACGLQIIGARSPDPADAKKTVYLNRVMRYVTTNEGPQVETEHDQRHVDRVQSSMTLRDAKSVATPSGRVSSHARLGNEADAC